MSPTSLIIVHRLVLSLLVVGFFVWILDQHIPFAGTRVMEYTSGVPHSDVTRLHPLDRVQTDESARIEKIIEDPVYFEVKTSVSYERATVRVRTQNHASVPLSIGLKRGEEARHIELRPLTEEGHDGEWLSSSTSFDLTGFVRMNDRYHFLISLPGVQYEHPERGYLLLSNIIITLERKPASWRDYLGLL